ncbi:MAG TPA: phosphotransferase [Nitrospirales bacterium]|nr:phosphotransferase [Nitrospirales bacterium]
MSAILEQLAHSIAADFEGWRDHISRQRWFGGKNRVMTALRWRDWACVTDGPPLLGFGWLELTYADGASEQYLLPLAIAAGGPQDAAGHPELARALLEGVRTEAVWTSACGRIFCLRTPALDTVPPDVAGDVRLIGGEQSNTTLRFGRAAILKLIRKCVTGVNLDAEVLGFLNRRGFPHVPRLLGEIRYETPHEDADATIGLLVEFIEHRSNGWSHVLERLGAIGGDRELASDRTGLLADLDRLGAITAELHVALASDHDDPDFRPEPITEDDIGSWRADIRRQLDAALAALGRGRQTWIDPEHLQPLDALDELRAQSIDKVRIHGDYHLGQVLKTASGFTVLDFEGEPARPLAARRAKACALKDVAGMLRSFSYAGSVALREPALRDAWDGLAMERFLAGYFGRARPGTVRFLPPTTAGVMHALQAFLIEKAAYEIVYEANNRPDWVPIPLEGLRRLVA